MLILTAVLALLGAGAPTAVWWVRRALRAERALRSERASRRLMEARQHRDNVAFAAQVQDLTNADAVLDEAARIVDTALAALPARNLTDPNEEEGGSS